jgi:hypothetical protein
MTEGNLAQKRRGSGMVVRIERIQKIAGLRILLSRNDAIGVAHETHE